MKKKQVKKIVREELTALLYMEGLWERIENAPPKDSRVKQLSDSERDALQQAIQDQYPAMGGSPENPVLPREPRGYETAPSDLVTNPMGGDAVPVSQMTPNRDPGASDYTFWFTEEELARLGIPEMQYHLEEVPGSGGRLRIVAGPPTSLLPGHEEILREKMDKAAREVAEAKRGEQQ